MATETQVIRIGKNALSQIRVIAKTNSKLQGRDVTAAEVIDNLILVYKSIEKTPKKE